jgi:uncharacterized membrane protein
MSKAPAGGPRPPKASVGVRSFKRKQPKPALSARRSAAAARTARGRRTLAGTALRRVPAAAWACALIAFLNASAWALLVPPFQGKDENAHFAYIEELAENGTLPSSGSESFPEQEELVMQGLHAPQVTFSPAVTSISSVAEQRTLTQDADANVSRAGTGGAGIAEPEPPLYYALQTIPYALGGGNILVQLQLMRLLGAFLGALTALLALLFLREILPSTPWAATIGGLCVALQPAFAFMSGSVNPDSMLYPIAAAVFLCLARALRRGLTRRLAIALGVLTVLGFLTKLNFIGFAFGVFAGITVLAARGVKAQGRRGLAYPAIAAGIGALPPLVYELRNILANHATGGVAATGTSVLTPSSLWHEVSYIWELYLPRLPGMVHYFQGLAPYKDIWFDRSVGLYGWMDTLFPAWVDNVALIPAAALVLLCARGLFMQRRALRAHLAELGIYTTITLGVLFMIAASSYLSDAVSHQLAFGEPRYLLPLLPLIGAGIAFAVRGAGPRWAPVAGAAIVVLFLGHDVLSQLQVVARYYG